MKTGPIEGCKSCKQFSEQSISDLNPVAHGSIDVDDEKIQWVLIKSRRKSVEKGSHFIFTSFSHHVGVDEIEARAALNAEATKVALKLLGRDYRMVSNSGLKASTRTHYHVHLISPGQGERLPRVVVNTQSVLEALRSKGVSAEVVEFLEGALLEQGS